MEILWLGHSCFRLRSREATILTDPFQPSTGYPLSRQTADVVTISHQHPGHNNSAGIEGPPKVIYGPGEYEIAGALILGIQTYHDAQSGRALGGNTVYVIQMEEISLCHLGDLGHVPTSAQIQELGKVDVLMVPVGGATTLDVTAAAETVGLLEPKIVIPMHYRTEKARPELAPLADFLKEMGTAEVASQPRLNVTRSSLPHETQVVVLDSRG